MYPFHCQERKTTCNMVTQTSQGFFSQKDSHLIALLLSELIAAWKIIPDVLVSTLLFEEVPSISRDSDTSSHHFSCKSELCNKNNSSNINTAVSFNSDEERTVLLECKYSVI